MKTICTSFLVGAALLSGCTNNEYPAHKKPMPYDFMTPTQKARLYQKGMERSARDEQLKYDLEEEGYKVEYGGGLY